MRPLEHTHHHYHSPEEKKRQLNRLARLTGHLEHIRTMIEQDEDCADVLVQLSAVRSAITGLGKEIINEHITHCISHAIEDGDEDALKSFQNAIEKFL
jgi:DNA-binding FrmR family transcriptional regulator